MVKADPPHTTVRYLDDIEWRQRTEFGRAYSEWTFLCTSNFKFDKSKDASENSYGFVVTAVEVKTGLELFQTLPIGVKEPLRKHEEMHCTMSADCYKDAEQLANRLAKEMIGKKFVIRNAVDEDAAEKAALLDARRMFASEYKEHTSMVADKLAVIFDRVTNHGLNGVSNKDGRQQSIDEYKEQEKADAADHKGDLLEQHNQENGSQANSDTVTKKEINEKSVNSEKSDKTNNEHNEQNDNKVKNQEEPADSQKWAAPIIESAKTESPKGEAGEGQPRPR